MTLTPQDVREARRLVREGYGYEDAAARLRLPASLVRVAVIDLLRERKR
jgi:hypothetical protein